MRYVLPLFCLLSAAPASAQTVDVSGAEALTANLARYIGTTAFDKGVVKVTVQDDAYRVEVDFNKLLSLFPTQDTMKLEIEPYVLSVKPRPDATWDIAGDLWPNGKVELKAEEGTHVSQWQIADDSFSGVYDPALAGFLAATGKNGAISMTSTDPASSTEFTAASGNFQVQSTRNPTKGVDFTVLQTLSGMVQTMRIAAPEAGMDLPIVLRSPELSYSSSATGAQTQQMLDLLAFGVANADEAKIKAAQPQLKTLLREALPLWEHITGAYGWRELSVGTPVGIFSAANAKIDVAMDGVRNDSTITYKFQIDDLTVPADVLPRWTLPLLPEDISLNLGSTELDLDEPVAAAIEAFDLNRDPPISEKDGEMIMAQFMANPPKLVINRSIVRNKDTEITAEGEVTFAGASPAMTATVEAAGFDKAMQTIQEATATAPEAQQAYMVAVAAKGFAKTLADGRLQWVIEMAPDGAVTVNGAMVKPADPPTPQ
jgi:hypothetical protein